LKVSMITARAGTAKHNDRTFDYLKESHIDPSRVKDNIYMSYKNLPFTEAEKAYYKDHYSGWLNTQNKKYREKGKRDKIRSTAKLLSRKMTAPEETILQIGNRKESPSKEVFESCVRKYMEYLQGFSSNCHILNVAIHNDEETPHAHIRCVWDYTDENGHLHIGQGRALKELGIPLPDNELPENGRYNNRKITFQKEARMHWQQIAKEHGIEIETEPDYSNREHLHKQELIIREQKKEIQENEKTLAKQALELTQNQEALRILMEILREAEKEVEEKGEKSKARKRLEQAGLAGFLTPEIVRDFLKERG